MRESSIVPTPVAGLLGAGLALAAAATTAQPNPADLDWQPLSTIQIARTETTVGQFRRFVAATGTVTAAERRGGGEVYAAGWEQRRGWTWKAPFGAPASDDEPAVHLTWAEADAFCRWAGGRLPTDAEWVGAAYTEQRERPPPPFERDRTYPYPTGERPDGAMCLGDCGDAAARAVTHGAPLSRGFGHAVAGRTQAGVNGLHDMGGNAWEWVDEPAGAGPAATAERRTRGGSWWYGALQMRARHLQSKPPGTAVVYIGFRCARDYVR
jgi:formylglycine-generating enzyme required for sulfatase activity